MPPKKKKSGKKSKKGKVGKGQEPQMSMEEAILLYQLDIKSNSKQDLIYELKSLQEKNERLKARNKRLKEEQLLHIKSLLKQAKEKDKEVEQTAEVGHEQVEKALLDKFDILKKEEAEYRDCVEMAERKEKQIEEVRKQVKRYLEYKDKGRYEHEKQIKVLNQELNDMEESHSDIADHLERSLKIAKEEIETYTESTLAKQKDIASEKAADSLDNASRQEILDNRWLKKEVHIHRQGCEELTQAVEKLEKSNLEIMSEMFDCKVDDLKITRQIFLAKEDSSDEEILAADGTVAEFEENPEDEMSSVFPIEGSFENPHQLGTMELQLLSVTGTSKPIHQLYEPDGTDSHSRENEEGAGRTESYGHPREWPVTNQMLQTFVTQGS